MKTLLNLYVYVCSYYLYLTLIGLGFSIYIVPPKLRRFFLIFSPIIGFSILSFIGFKLYISGYVGTDSYIGTLTFICFSCSMLLVYLRRRSILEFLPTVDMNAYIASLIVITVLSVPMIDQGRITAFSIGNLDIFNHIGKTRQAKEFSNKESKGFLGQTTYDHYDLRENRFGSPFASAIISSVLDIYPETAEMVMTYTFLFILISIFYVLIVTVFGFPRLHSFLVSIWFGLSSVSTYILLHGFEAQIVGEIYIIAFVLFFVHCIENGDSFSESVRNYSLASALSFWGLSITYAHVIPLILVFVCGYALLNYYLTRNIYALKSAISIVAIALLSNLLLAPYRTLLVFDNTLRHSLGSFGWSIPYIYPIKILGIFSIDENPNPILAWSLSSLFVLYIFSIYKIKISKLHKNVIFPIYSLTYALISYNSIYHLGAYKAFGDQYKAFKIMSYLLPFTFPAMLPYLIKVTNNISGLLCRYIYTILILATLTSSLTYLNYSRHSRFRISDDIIDLHRISKMPYVRSLNILLNDAFEILTVNSFLLEKKMYFSSPSYEGRDVGPLKGEWDLLKWTDLPREHSGYVYPLNSTFILRPHNQSITITPYDVSSD